jgi:hypothetical protein
MARATASASMHSLKESGAMTIFMRCALSAVKLAKLMVFPKKIVKLGA